MSGGGKPSSASGGGRLLSAQGVRHNPDMQRSRPTSADWTRGNEVHMEGREPFEVSADRPDILIQS